MSGEDIMLWPDGTWCYRDEVAEFTHMSDDYEVVEAFTDRWLEIISAALR